MLLRAGDIIDEDIGETRVKEETMNVAAHFRFMDPINCQTMTCLHFAGEPELTILWIIWIDF
jgi:hypothetical protein